MIKNVVINILIYLGCLNGTDLTVNVNVGHPLTQAPAFSLTSGPTFAPTFPVTDGPTVSITNGPTFAPTFPVTDGPTVSITNGPTFAPTFPVTDEPTVSVTTEPTIAPTIYQCQIPDQADVLWLIDGSTSMIPETTEYEIYNNVFIIGQELVKEFTDTVVMNNVTGWRQSFVLFAGEYWNSRTNQYINFKTVVDNLPFTDDEVLFKQRVSSLLPPGGTTNLSGVIEFTREYLINEETQRNPQVPRYVVLVGDGEPSDKYGETTDLAIFQALDSIKKFKVEDNVKLVYIRLGTVWYNNAWLNATDDQSFFISSMNDVSSLLSSGDFLCM
jgi:hypothetical protein